MTQSRWWIAIAVMSLALVAGAARSGEKPTGKGNLATAHDGKNKSKLVTKTYSIAALVEGEKAIDTKGLLKAVLRNIKPKSWVSKGGPGTIHYDSATKTLTVKQTPSVQQQIRCVLQTLVAVRSESPLPPSVVQASCTSVCHGCDSRGTPSSPERKSSSSDHRKQYGHFVLDNVKVNAMGVSCSIRRMRFQYKGDGIDPDVAKCALTNGESEKKTMEAPKAVTDLLEKLEKMSGGSCAVERLPAPSIVPAAATMPVESAPSLPAPRPAVGEKTSTAPKSSPSMSKPDKAGESGEKVEKGKAKPVEPAPPCVRCLPSPAR